MSRMRNIKRRSTVPSTASSRGAAPGPNMALATAANQADRHMRGNERADLDHLLRVCRVHLLRADADPPPTLRTRIHRLPVGASLGRSATPASPGRAVGRPGAIWRVFSAQPTTANGSPPSAGGRAVDEIPYWPPRSAVRHAIAAPSMDPAGAAVKRTLAGTSSLAQARWLALHTYHPRASDRGAALKQLQRPTQCPSPARDCPTLGRKPPRVPHQPRVPDPACCQMVKLSLCQVACPYCPPRLVSLAGRQTPPQP
jgi:hypothetical protein